MRRRDFMAVLGGAAALWPARAVAQQSVHIVGVLASQPLPPVQKLVRKLREYGYVEGENLRLQSRFAEGYDDRYPKMAEELVKLSAEVIVTWGTPAAIAAKQASQTIPIVMAAIGDPVSVGIVPDLAHPGGNITGFAAQNVDLEGKRLELLKEIVPNLSRVGILANATNPLLPIGLQKLQPAASELGVSVDVFEVRNSDDVEGALGRLQQARPEGVLVAPDLLLVSKRAEIASVLISRKLPAVYPFREYAAVGGLIIHGANLSILSERAAAYVDRILKGAKAGDLPVQLANEFELIINLKTAQQMGLTIPPTLIARADEVLD